jgi:hypothetical protein
VAEHTNRPDVMGALDNMILTTQKFLKQAKNISEGDYFFNETELIAFEKMVNEVMFWKEEGEEKQNARKNYEVRGN